MAKTGASLLGFTLIELVMVIVIIGMLAAIVIPNFSAQREQASIATTKANLESLRTAIAFYYADVGSWIELDITSPPLRNLFDGGAPGGRIYLDRIPEETILQSPNATTISLGAPTGTGGWSWDSGIHRLLPNLIGDDANGVPYNQY